MTDDERAERFADMAMAAGPCPECGSRGVCACTGSIPLTDAEVAELDTYGEIDAFTPLPPRAMELWEREILHGRATPPSGRLNGLLGYHP